MPDPGSDGYREHAPHPALRPWVECFWTRGEAAGSRASWAEFPSVQDGRG